MRRYNLTPVITQEVGEAMTIIGLVSAGLGVSILPASFKRVQLNEMRWVPIAEEDAVSEMWSGRPCPEISAKSPEMCC